MTRSKDRTPRRAAHHPVQPDPDAPSAELKAFGDDEPTARSTPKAIAADRQRATTAPGEPPPEVLAREAYRGHVEQITTQALSPAQLTALRADSVRPDLDRTTPTPRRRR